MEKENLCLNCHLAVWIREKADLGRLPKKKRIEFRKEIDKVGADIEEQLFPFIWCPTWKEEKLYPYDNKMIGCKFYQKVWYKECRQTP